MSRQARSRTLNIPLKVAIVASAKRQRDVGRAVRIHEVRLSKIVNGRGIATAIEQARLAKYLGRDIAELFA